MSQPPPYNPAQQPTYQQQAVPVASEAQQTYVTATYIDCTQPPPLQTPYGTGIPVGQPYVPAAGAQAYHQGYPQAYPQQYPQAYPSQYPQANPQPTVYSVTTTAPDHIIMSTQFERTPLLEGPTLITCPHCRHTGLSDVSYTPGFTAFAICILSTICCGLPLCCVLCPCCGTCLHDKQHYCERCHGFIGTRRSSI